MNPGDRCEKKNLERKGRKPLPLKKKVKKKKSKPPKETRINTKRNGKRTKGKGASRKTPCGSKRGTKEMETKVDLRPSRKKEESLLGKKKNHPWGGGPGINSSCHRMSSERLHGRKMVQNTKGDPRGIPNLG